jgi:hypothetical protein
MMKTFALWAAFLFSAAASTAEPAPFYVTIDAVALKSASGGWVTVIRPDKKVDLLVTEPTIGFFNNLNRVPPGEYVNVMLTVSEDSPAATISYAIENDFAPVTVKKASFVSVKFRLDIDKRGLEAVEALALTIDGYKRAFGRGEIAVDRC